jgi:mannitol-1-phosphate 5-dehydrogenase
VRRRADAGRNGDGGVPPGRVVIIGPGKLGCGYLAPTFLDAGWETILATHSRATAAHISHAGGFSVRVGAHCEEFELRHSPVVVGSAAFRRAVSGADLVVTAVGRENVCGLGRPLARALARRHSSPLDLWVVENADAAPLLEHAVRSEAARSGIALPSLGFAGGVAIPVVARGSWDEPGRPEFVRDTADGLLIDESALVSPLPELSGVHGTTLYRERLREKLFVFNAGHALFAYLGARCQYNRIDEAARDPLLRTLVEGCLLETRRAVIRTHRGLGSAVVAPVAEAMRRYENVGLADTILRVARRPMRKLDPDGPLVGAAELVSATFGRVPVPFALAIASALLHSDLADPEVRRLAAMLRRQGIQAVLLDVCGLAPDKALARRVMLTYRRMRLGQEVAHRRRAPRRRRRRRTTALTGAVRAATTT